MISETQHQASSIQEPAFCFPTSLKRIIKEARLHLVPPENITVSEWAEKYRQLPDYAKMSGLWTNRMAPFGVKIMDAFNDPLVEEVTYMGSAQISKTEILNNVIGYYIHNNPQSIIVMQPTIEMAKVYSKEKLEPMINDTKVLKDLVSKRKATNSDNVTLYKRFVGGFIFLVGANSPHRLRQLSAPIVLVDDTDSIYSDVGAMGMKEGDPIRRAEKRAKTFKGIRKFGRFSTPTIKNESWIETSYNQSNMQKYWVPCIKCGHYQILIFENLKWDKKKDLFGKTDEHLTDTVYYECESENCKHHLIEKDKYDMVQAGEWRAENPNIYKHQGYWINELYSLFSTWQEVVEDFLKSKDDPETLMVHYNLTRGLTFERNLAAKLPDKTGLMKRNEDYLTEKNPNIPNGVLLLTCSADTHPDRLIVKVKGWGIGEESWVLYNKILYGDPDRDEAWEQLDEVRAMKFKRDDGVELGIQITFVDSGGENTQSVYEYCMEHYPETIAIKGNDGHSKPMVLNMSKKGDYRQYLVLNLGVDTAKSTIYQRLKKDYRSGHKVMHFTSAICNEEYFDGLVSEKPRRKYDRKYGVTIEWVKKRKNIRNEPLDNEVYNLCAMKYINPDFDELEAEYKKLALEIKEGKVNEEKEDGFIVTESGSKRRKTSTRRRN